MNNDVINRPSHYTQGDGIEPIDFIESNSLNFCEGNVVKYVVRAPYKGTEVQDLKKARFYLNRLIKQAEKQAA